MSNASDQMWADVVAAMGVLPEEFMDTNDDKCDCTFVRIGMWTNPYLAETLEVRMCCIWKSLYELFPQHVRVTPAFLDYNAGQWVTEPQEWNGEDDMPRSLWYRQQARKNGGTVSQMRTEFADAEAPKGTPRPVEEGEPPVDLVAVLFEMIDGLAQEIGSLKAQMESRE